MNIKCELDRVIRGFSNAQNDLKDRRCGCGKKSCLVLLA